MTDERETMLIPELSPARFETIASPEGYAMRATRELTGRMQELEIAVVIKALEKAGYEVRKVAKT